MLIKTPEMAQVHDTEALREAELTKQADWVKSQLEDAVYVQNNDTSPTNYARQLGQPLVDTVVEQKLAKILPQLRFDFNKNNPTKKAMYLLKPNGELEFLMAYERGIIPERSVMQEQIKETLDPAMLGAGKLHIDRGDLAKHEVRPHEFNADGTLKNLGEVTWDDRDVRPGMTRTKLPWFEAKRGYRAMAALLVGMGYISSTQAEQAFGRDNRPEWARAMKTGVVKVW